MDIDLNSLLAGFVVSGVGFVLLSYGRKMSRAPHIGAGLVLLIFPYFVGNVLLMLGIAAAIGAALYVAIRSDL